MPDWTAAAHLRLADWHPRSRLAAHVTEVDGTAVPSVDVHNHLGRWLTPPGWTAPDVGALLALMDRRNVATVVNLDGMRGDELEANLDRYDRAHPDAVRHLLPARLDAARAARRRGAAGGAAARLRPARRPRAQGLEEPRSDRPRRRRAPRAAGRRPGGAHPRPRRRARPPRAHPRRRPGRVLRPGGRAQRAHRRAAGQPGLVVRRPHGAPDVRPPADGARDPRAGDTRDHVHRRARGLRRRRTSTGSNACCRPPRTGTSTSPGGWPSSGDSRGAPVGWSRRSPTGCSSARTPTRSPTRPSSRTSGSWRPPTRRFEYAPGEVVPPQGRWTVSGLHLSPSALEAVYAGNARRILRL